MRRSCTWKSYDYIARAFDSNDTRLKCTHILLSAFILLIVILCERRMIRYIYLLLLYNSLFCIKHPRIQTIYAHVCGETCVLIRESHRHSREIYVFNYSYFLIISVFSMDVYIYVCLTNWHFSPYILLKISPPSLSKQQIQTEEIAHTQNWKPPSRALQTLKTNTPGCNGCDWRHFSNHP